MLKKSFRTFVLMPVACLFTAILVACGGSGAGVGTAAIQQANAPKVDPISALAKSIVVLTSAAAIPSDSRTGTTITVFVKDASNRALKGATVDLSTTDAGSVLQVPSNVTGDDGTLTATLKSNNKDNRSIEIKAAITNTTLTGVVVVPVTGSTVTISGPQALTAGKSGSYTIAVRDSGGTPLSLKEVTVKSTLSNGITPIKLTTDVSGQATFILSASTAGSDTVSVTAAGATGVVPVSIVAASASVTISGIALNQEIPVGTPRPVDVVLVDASGTPVGNSVVNITTTRGPATSDAAGLLPIDRVTTAVNGRATFYISSSSAGVNNISVQSVLTGKPSASTQIEFISSNPTVINLQIGKPVIPINLGGSSANTSPLVATVRDPQGNPVKNVTVNFTAENDPSSGSINPPSATTDSGGVASVAFVSGPNISGPNLVNLRATVAGLPAVTSTANMTVSGREVSVRLGTGNSIAVDGVRYKYPWTALVVDSSGAPIQGANVAIQLITVEYKKGSWTKASGSWAPETGAVNCPGEDGLNGGVPNSRMDAGEDININNALDGFGIATAFFNAGSLTGANGFVDFDIIYPKTFALWTKIRIDAKITVSGSESVISESFYLPILRDDATGDSPPALADLRGPFGSALGAPGPRPNYPPAVFVAAPACYNKD